MTPATIAVIGTTIQVVKWALNIADSQNHERKMKKNDKKLTREQQYAAILGGTGIDGTPGVAWDACIVLGFRFPDNAHVRGLHYDLMNAHVEYLLFDSMADGTAIVIISRESEQADRIRAIAERAGGTEYKPNLKM